MNTQTFRISSLLALSIGTVSLVAQTAATAKKAPVHHSASATTATHRPVSACIKHPEASPKIPALPAGACIKTLYSIEESATHLDPQLSAPLRGALEKLNQKFSLDYVDLKIGTGELAQPQKWYSVNYTGYLIDGTVFDSTSKHTPIEPFTFPYGAHRVIQGWDTGFEGMHIGGKRRLFIPYQIAYGESGRPPTIPAKAELIFDMELVAISDKPPTPPTPPAAPPATTKPAAPSAPAPTGSPAGAAAPPPINPTTPPASATPKQ
ncbi:MAG TPA: FKBP-type peptidyl-prolyl cis-trans isomerase [Acidobacteriaceae bacterium]